MNQTEKVAIVYPFFAHYREPVMRSLITSGRHAYVLVGDLTDPASKGVKAWQPDDPERFVRAPARLILGRVLVQQGLIRLALRRDVRAIIYFGAAHYASTWTSAIVARLTGKRVLFWTIGWHREERGLKDIVRRLFYRLPHGLLLYGHFAKMIALRKRFAPERLYVVYNSLNFEAQRVSRDAASGERVRAVRAELFRFPDRPMVICVTRLVSKRRLDLLLESMILLRRDGVELNCLLVGEGPERDSLERTASACDLTVHFYGACYDERRLAELVSAADATVAPGMVGLAAMQSLAYGTPVVTHDDWARQAPEWESIVPGKGGFLFRYGDSADLARAIRDCVANLGVGKPGRRHLDEPVQRFYNPDFQRRVIDRAVSGEPADDLFWQREVPSTTENAS